jgi:TRAP-type uncharacterized transport system fused permease subunit
LTLFVLFMEPGAAALYTAGATVVVTLVKKEVRAAWSWSKLDSILQRTSRTLFELTAISAAAGFVVGLVGYTGLGLSLSRVLTKAAGGSLIVLALLTAMTSTLLGMGMPTTAAYILLAVLAAPALTNLGIEPILAHLFIFYFGTLSMLTPPVCLAVYTAGSIAKAPQMPLALRAMRLAVAGYIVPFVFLYVPGLAFIGSAGEILLAIVAALLAVTVFAFAIEGYFLSKIKWFERILCLAAAVAFLTHTWSSRGVGLVLLALFLGFQLRKRAGRRAEVQAQPHF